MQAKSAEISWLDARLAMARAVLKDGGPGREPGELSDLLAYRAEVGRIPDRPLTPHSYVRFALYLLIPLRSWAATAVVERVGNTLIS